MANLYRDLNEAALAANLNKNPLLVFHAMMNQTFGFGKSSDPLTDKRLAALTGIRPDRLRPAVEVVIKKGLFDCKPHPRFDHEYSIGKTFLEAYQNRVSTPFITKKMDSSEKQNPIFGNHRQLPEKRGHTVTTKALPPISKKPQPTVPLAEQQSVKIFFTEREQVPDSFAIETSSANTRIEFAFGNQQKPVSDNPIPITEAVTESKIKPPTTTPKTTQKLKKIMTMVKTPSTDNKPKIPQPTNTKTVPAWYEAKDAAIVYLDRIAAEKEANKPTAVCGSGFNQEKKPPPQPSIALPASIDKENINVCESQLRTLTQEQQQKVVVVFNEQLKKGHINSKADYFISLVKAAKNGQLTVPCKSTVNASQPSEKAIAEEKARERRIDLWSSFRWLEENAALQQVDLATLAKQMGEKMEEAYAMFAKE